MGVDLGVKGDGECDGVEEVDMRLLATTLGTGEQEPRSLGKKKAALRHAEWCNTGDIDRTFSVFLSARILDAN